MITKDNILRIMEIFFKHPDEKFHLRRLSRITGLSMPGVKKIAEKLEREGLLFSKRENVVKNFYASRNEKFLSIKRAYNMNSIFSSGLLDFLRDKYEEPESIILFGSYSRGDDISKSDIDLAIITSKHPDVDVTPFEKKLDRKIEVIEVRMKNAEKEFLNTLANGIVLHGFLRVIK